MALLTTEPRYDGMEQQVILGVPDDLVSGGDFLAYGYPVEGPPAGVPVGRLMKGHFQRYFRYQNSAGQAYFAGEMSIAAPAGSSGGPLVRASAPQQLEGVITSNVDSYAVLDYVDEVDEDGKRLRVETHRIVSYGVAAMAISLRDWLAALTT